MSIRARFDQQLAELSQDILNMGEMVGNELTLALDAFAKLDTDLAQQVFEMDFAVNEARFRIEYKCSALIATQQPAARDLRAILAAMSMIVDLERMGDQAKGIAKVIPHVLQHPLRTNPPQLTQMGLLVNDMLEHALIAYANSDVQLAQKVARQDDQVDQLYGEVFRQLICSMAESGSPDQVEATYEELRVARELERYGDLATNVAERVIYLVTGRIEEINMDNNGTGNLPDVSD